VENFSDANIYSIQLDILKEMREDEKHVIKAMKDLGFSVDESVPAPRITQYNFYQEGKNKKVLSTNEVEIMDKFSNLDPVERDRMRRQIAGTISELEFEENGQQEKNQQTENTS